MALVGEKIKNAREAAGMTQEQLGKLLGVTGVAVMRYEKGTRQPSINQRLLLSDIFQTSLLYFIDQDIYEEKVVGVYPFAENKPSSKDLLSAFDLLNDDGKQKAIERIQELTEIPRYKKTTKKQEGEQVAVDPQEND